MKNRLVCADKADSSRIFRTSNMELLLKQNRAFKDSRSNLKTSLPRFVMVRLVPRSWSSRLYISSVTTSSGAWRIWDQGRYLVKTHSSSSSPFSPKRTTIRVSDGLWRFELARITLLQFNRRNVYGRIGTDLAINFMAHKHKIYTKYRFLTAPILVRALLLCGECGSRRTCTANTLISISILLLMS